MTRLILVLTTLLSTAAAAADTADNTWYHLTKDSACVIERDPVFRSPVSMIQVADANHFTYDIKTTKNNDGKVVVTIIDFHTPTQDDNYFEFVRGLSLCQDIVRLGLQKEKEDMDALR